MAVGVFVECQFEKSFGRSPICLTIVFFFPRPDYTYSWRRVSIGTFVITIAYTGTEKQSSWIFVANYFRLTTTGMKQFHPFGWWRKFILFSMYKMLRVLFVSLMVGQGYHCSVRFTKSLINVINMMLRKLQISTWFSCNSEYFDLFNWYTGCWKKSTNLKRSYFTQK